MARIYWDDEDREKLARETMRVMKESGLGTMSAFQLAQNVLKPEKRRKIPGLKAVSWLAGEMEKQKRVMDAEGIREAELAAAREEGAREARANPPAGMLWTLLQGQLVQSGSSLLKNMLLNVLRDEEVLEALSNAVGSTRTVAPADLSMPVMPTGSAGLVSRTATRLAKVLVLGLKPGQAKDIERQFQQCFNFEFAEAASSHHQLRQHAQTASFIISMRFINHSDEEQITSTARDRYMRIEGVLTRLREALTYVYTHNKLPVAAYRQAGATAH